MKKHLILTLSILLAGNVIITRSIAHAEMNPPNPYPIPICTPSPYHPCPSNPHPAPYPTSEPEEFVKRRLDCRFYDRDDERKFCYASADYKVGIHYKLIREVHFGVGCNEQTIFDGKGTIEPQETVADHIRPFTAATPLIQVDQQNDLREVGSYDAKLEVYFGKIMYGHCYVKDKDYRQSLE